MVTAAFAPILKKVPTMEGARNEYSLKRGDWVMSLGTAWTKYTGDTLRWHCESAQLYTGIFRIPIQNSTNNIQNNNREQNKSQQNPELVIHGDMSGHFHTPGRAAEIPAVETHWKHVMRVPVGVMPRKYAL